MARLLLEVGAMGKGSSIMVSRFWGFDWLRSVISGENGEAQLVPGEN